jgi:hypothetical protein
MSYDLFLRPKTGSFSQSDFDEYFSKRKFFNLEGNQAWYENEGTGVYFLFEFQEIEGIEENEIYYPVAFNMNYFRPSNFVIEAEPEVRAFIETHAMIVEDPQTNGMGTGEYNSEKFTNGWLHGNEFGYSAILKDHPEVSTLPQKKLHDAWKWNYKKEELQGSLSDDIFVPSIMFLSYRGIPVTAAVWPDAIPSVIPEVDVLLIGRIDLAPKKFFKKTEDMVVGDWEEFQPLLDMHKSKMHGNSYYMYYESVPKKIKKAIKNLKPSGEDELQGLGKDQVLDREIVQKYVS